MPARPLPRPESVSRTRPLTVIVRALPGAALEGRVAGQVEVVDTGEVLPVSDTDELLALLARLAADQEP